MPFRVGVNRRTISLPDPIAKTGFTIGSGVSFGPAKVDFSAGYEMASYYQHDQFPESWLGEGDADLEYLDRVEEGNLTGTVSVIVEF